jgi:acyl-CoA thioesterase FadM
MLLNRKAFELSVYFRMNLPATLIYLFQGQAFVEDTLHVHTAVTQLGNASLQLDMTILRLASEQVIGTGFIAGVMVDSMIGQSVRIPETFREVAARYQA